MAYKTVRCTQLSSKHSWITIKSVVAAASASKNRFNLGGAPYCKDFKKISCKPRLHKKGPLPCVVRPLFEERADKVLSPHDAGKDEQHVLGDVRGP